MRTSARRLVLAPALTLLDVFAPIHGVWWALFGVPLLAILHWAVGLLAAFPVTLVIGPFGLAVIATTILVRLVLLPLTVYQARAGLRARQEAAAVEARLAPAIARLRRRHRGRPLEFQRALLELKRREGIDPLAGAGAALRGTVLPALVQMPVLVALYWVILTFAHAGHDLHFLWIANLALPDPIVLPLLVGLATYVLTRLTSTAQPPSSEEDEQVATTRRTLTVLSPLGLVVAAHFAPAALALYWMTGSIVGAGQQWLVGRFLVAGAATAA